MAKSIKSRYKICFQTQNKVWIYKNSRLRNFYKIRSKIVLLQGKTVKNFLITNNMKWTVIRRKMVPYIRTKNRFRFQYRNLFFNKQQLKNFYGGIQEYKLRNIFKKTWNVNLFYRRNIFIGALEQRINIVLFRMRLLPTIFASTQFIMHKGIFANETLITLPSYRVKLGEIISIPQDQWFIFYKFLYERLYNRYFGESLLIWRKEYSLKKIQYYRLKNKKFYIKNLRFFKKYSVCKKRFFYLKKLIKLILIKFLNKKHKNYKNNLNSLFIINIFIEKILRSNLLKIQKNLKKLRRWSSPVYYKNLHFIFYRMFFIEKNLLRIQKFLIKFIENIFYKKKKKLNKILFNKLIINKKNFKRENILHMSWYNSYKKMLFIKPKTIKYNKRLFYLIKQLKYRKKKKRIFKNWCSRTHWYTPNYLEIDYRTLRSVFVYYPEANEVVYGFPCSFNKIISFYKERAL